MKFSMRSKIKSDNKETKTYILHFDDFHSLENLKTVLLTWFNAELITDYHVSNENSSKTNRQIFLQNSTLSCTCQLLYSLWKSGRVNPNQHFHSNHLEPLRKRQKSQQQSEQQHSEHFEHGQSLCFHRAAFLIQRNI